MSNPTKDPMHNSNETAIAIDDAITAAILLFCAFLTVSAFWQRGGQPAVLPPDRLGRVGLRSLPAPDPQNPDPHRN